MEILKDEDIHLRFLLGLTVTVDGIGEFRSPLLKDIVKLTENKYNMAISSVLFKKDKLDIDQKEIAHLSDFQVLSAILYQDISSREVFFSAMELHFNKTPQMHEDGFIYFDELVEENILNEEKLDYIRRLVSIANNFKEKEEDEFDAGNEAARKFIENQKRKRALLDKAKKQKVNLHSIISAIGWKSQTFDFINHLNIYQLYDGYSRLQLIDNYHHTMDGIYGGTIDGSKIKLDDLNWANILNT